MDRLSMKTAFAQACRTGRWLAAALMAAFSFQVLPASAATEATTTPADRIVCATAPDNTTGTGSEGNPARAFVSGDFVFVLERYNHRVAVYDLVGKTNLFYYGASDVNNAQSQAPGTNYVLSTKWASGKRDGGFVGPLGMALDTFSGQNRFAVADTGNNRVQLFTFDPATGEITFAATTASVFFAPSAVAFTESGDILVADSGNKRVVRLTVSGSSLTVGDTYALGEKAYPTGICSDSDTSEGFWITDSKNQRVAYYRIADGTSTPVVSFGTTADKELVTPHDVQIFGDSDNGKFLCVVDNQGSRLRIMEAVVSGGAYSEIIPAGDVGSYADASLQEYEKLWRPKGVFVDSDSGVVYVADTGHNLVKWYEVSPESPDQPEPPEPDKYFRFLSVQTFDESGTPCTEFTNHQTIAFSATFETDDEITAAKIVCYKSGGSFFVQITKGLPTISGDTISYSDIGNHDNSTPYYGTLDIEVTAFCANGNYTTNVVAAYTLVEPQPAEEYEEVWWHTTSITIVDEKATLTWSMPTAADGLPSDGICDFRIDWRTSLTEGVWSASPVSYTIEDVTTAAGCTTTIPLPASAHAFFRVYWTNKVKGVDP